MSQSANTQQNEQVNAVNSKPNFTSYIMNQTQEKGPTHLETCFDNATFVALGNRQLLRSKQVFYTRFVRYKQQLALADPNVSEEIKKQLSPEELTEEKLKETFETLKKIYKEVEYWRYGMCTFFAEVPYNPRLWHDELNDDMEMLLTSDNPAKSAALQDFKKQGEAIRKDGEEKDKFVETVRNKIQEELEDALEANAKTGKTEWIKPTKEEKK